MAEFAGTYKYESDDGKFDDLLKAIGVGILKRQGAKMASPTIIFTANDDGSITMATKSGLAGVGDTEAKFKLGEEFEEKRLDGVTVKSSITKDGNKLIHKQSGDPEVHVVREFDGDKLVATCKCKDVVCVRTYTKQ